MARSKRFITGLLSSYASMGVNIVYTFLSVPLALHYLDKEAFGMWGSITTLSACLMLLELGMNGSVTRSLSDHKDHVEDGIYGSILKTGARVFAVQGVLVALLGLAVGWFYPSLLKLPLHLHHSFFVLMAAQALLTGIQLATSAFAAPLWCHQRLDLSNLAGSLGLIATLAVLWIGFHLGWSLYSIPISTAAGMIVSLFVAIWSCRSLGLYPTWEYRGRFDPKIFRELLHFGSSLFLINLGAQLIPASQLILISSQLGMGSYAIWIVAIKIFNLAQQFVARILDSSAGGLAEMMVRKENALLLKRFRDIVTISAVMAVAASAGIALANGAFIEVWTSGKITWQPWNNFLLACVLFSTAVTRGHTGLVGLTKQIGGMKYVYLLEGITFVALSLAAVPWLGFAGILITALVCNIGITGSYGIWRTAGYFGISRVRVIGWTARPAWILLLTLVLFYITRLPALASLGAFARFSVGIIIFSTLIVPSIWFLGMSKTLRSELTFLIEKIYIKAKSTFRTA
jgi:O-antigen/teichoic acid export membrane protein